MIKVLKSLKLLKMSFNLLKVKKIQTKLKDKSNKEIINLTQIIFSYFQKVNKNLKMKNI